MVSVNIRRQLPRRIAIVRGKMGRKSGKIRSTRRIKKTRRTRKIRKRRRIRSPQSERNALILTKLGMSLSESVLSAGCPLSATLGLAGPFLTNSSTFYKSAKSCQHGKLVSRC